MLRSLLVLLLATATACFAPDSDGAQDSGASSGGTGGTHSFVPDDNCNTDDDCVGEGDADAGWLCVRYGSDGPSACRIPPPSCATNTCPDGPCIELYVSPVECSATAGFDKRDHCIVDECLSDDDCASGTACSPDFGYDRTCVPAACESDDDCTEERGGACLVLALGCCEVAVGGGPMRPVEVACAYPSDGCQTDGDCADDEYCVVTEGRAHCSITCP